MKLPRLSPLTANGRRFLLILLCTIPAAALYYGLPRLGFLYPHLVYIVLCGVLAVFYTIYNRGFATKGKTPDDLSADIPLPERERMIADGRRRMERSGWVLYLLLPMLFTLLIDTVILFLLPDWSVFP